MNAGHTQMRFLGYVKLLLCGCTGFNCARISTITVRLGNLGRNDAKHTAMPMLETWAKKAAEAQRPKTTR
jgi:hypothetical protein